MNRGAAQRWIYGVATAFFLAGLSIGLAVPVVYQAIRGPADTTDPDELFVRQLVDAYDLSADQIRSVRMILAAENADTRAIMQAKRETLPPEVTKSQNRTDERIRAILTKQQLARYVRDEQR